MGLTKYKFGDLIELSFIRNSDGEYGPDDTVGINIDKEIRKMKGDSSRKELKTFYLVQPDDFVYNPRGSRKLGLGYNNTSNTYITTFNNMIFRIKEDAKGKILPYYLFLYLSRKEWDRFAEFLSWGSSTEVFSWDTFCDIDISLPDLDVQKKFVDIYCGLLSNQQSYEHGLDDLQLTCDALIEKFKHSAPRVQLRDVVQEVDIRNRDGAITSVDGVNKAKQFMPTVASGEDISKYKVVGKNCFACNLMHVGRDVAVPIALNTEDRPIIVSPAYLVFNISNPRILPKYALIWMSRSETDRYAWFMCDASVRSGMEKSRFYDIDMPVPSIEEQKALVEVFEVLTLRRDINERLKEQIRDICPILIKGSLEEGMRE